MLLQITSFLLGTAADLLAVVFLLRAWMQWLRLPFGNSVGRFVIALSDWAVLPLRRLLPALGGIDLASVLAAFLVQLMYFSVLGAIAGAALGFGALTVLSLVWLAVLAEVRLFVYLLMGAVIITALLSWINPYSPFAPLAEALVRPLLTPLRRLIPPIGGVDLSPLAALVLLEVVLIVLTGLSPLRF